jgi:hypothetical protein
MGSPQLLDLLLFQGLLLLSTLTSISCFPSPSGGDKIWTVDLSLSLWVPPSWCTSGLSLPCPCCLEVPLAIWGFIWTILAFCCLSDKEMWTPCSWTFLSTGVRLKILCWQLAGKGCKEHKEPRVFVLEISVVIWLRMKKAKSILPPRELASLRKRKKKGWFV